MQSHHSKPDQKVGNTQLHIIHGNIADESTDVIVNTTAEDMNLTANAVSRAIAKKAGPKLQSACRNLIDSGLTLEKGKIAVTSACGSLRCKKVIHAHIPVRDDALRASIDPKQLVDKIVTVCLQKADSEGMQSISFPAFGTGAGGYAVEEIAECMLEALQRFAAQNPKSLKEVQIVIYEQDQHDKFHSYFCQFFGTSPTTHGSSSFLHGLMSTLGLGSQSKGTTVDLQGPKPRSLTVGSPKRPFAYGIRPSSLVSPIAVFKIFAASRQTAEQIATEIRTNIKDRVRDETVDEEFVEFLLEDDIQDMIELGDELGVVIEFLAKVKKIIISGEQAKVNEAKVKIIEMMRDIQKAKSELQIYQWYSVDSSGAQEPYPEAAAIRLERAYRRSFKLVELTIDNIDVLIDLQSMQETEKATGAVCEVKRVKRVPGTGTYLVYTCRCVSESLGMYMYNSLDHYEGKYEFY